jgi:hypothetical protein
VEYFIFQIAERLPPPAPHLLLPRLREKTELAAVALVLPGITYSTATTTPERQPVCGGVAGREEPQEHSAVARIHSGRGDARDCGCCGERGDWGSSFINIIEQAAQKSCFRPPEHSPVPAPLATLPSHLSPPDSPCGYNSHPSIES